MDLCVETYRISQLVQCQMKLVIFWYLADLWLTPWLAGGSMGLHYSPPLDTPKGMYHQIDGQNVIVGVDHAF